MRRWARGRRDLVLAHVKLSHARVGLAHQLDDPALADVKHVGDLLVGPTGAAEEQDLPLAGRQLLQALHNLDHPLLLIGVTPVRNEGPQVVANTGRRLYLPHLAVQPKSLALRDGAQPWEDGLAPWLMREELHPCERTGVVDGLARGVHRELRHPSQALGMSLIQRVLVPEQLRNLTCAHALKTDARSALAVLPRQAEP